MKVIAEKTGRIESTLKARVVEVLKRHRSVRRGYLLLAEVESGRREVVLCVATSASIESVVREIEAIFSRMFADSESLAIVAIGEVEEAKVRACASPFYEA